MKKILVQEHSLCESCRYGHALVYSKDIEHNGISVVDISTRYGIYFCEKHKQAYKKVIGCVSKEDCG